ncbi:MAG TPA: hypothetical protein VHT73_19395 [Thermodesulfobacteriota bacterium]|nr:hypothetical protein [Thermodesulfobacteriota bacterium]
MRQEDTQLYDILYAARRNAIWAAQGQNSITTIMHIGTTLHLIEIVMATLNQRITTKPTK